jgi:hypothetical protein
VILLQYLRRLYVTFQRVRTLFVMDKIRFIAKQRHIVRRWVHEKGQHGQTYEYDQKIRQLRQRRKKGRFLLLFVSDVKRRGRPQKYANVRILRKNPLELAQNRRRKDLDNSRFQVVPTSSKKSGYSLGLIQSFSALMYISEHNAETGRQCSTNAHALRHTSALCSLNTLTNIDQNARQHSVLNTGS